MNILALRRSVAVLTLVALGFVALVGCSTLPTAPAVEPRAADSESRLLRAPGETGLIGDLLDGTTALLQKTVKTITGITGGSVSAGRFTVEVPPGAISGSGEITVEVPDATVLRVNLHIKNAPNQFEVPVTLEVSWAGLEGSPEASPEHFSIFWLDEDAGVWRMLPSVVDLERKTVSTQLDHFSTYGVLEAKAGW